MSEWKKYKLADVAEIVGGGTPSTTNPNFWGNDTAWLTPRDLSNHTDRFISHGERGISTAGLENSSAKIIPANSILLTSRAPIGYLAIAKNEITTNQGFKSFIADKSKVDFLFLYYILQNNIDHLKQLGSGTTFAEISASTIRNIELSFPANIETQKRIASILGSLDDKIELNRQNSKTLEEMAQTLFKEMCLAKGEELPEGWKEGKLSFGVELNPKLSLKKGQIAKYVEMRDLSETSYSIRGYVDRAFMGGSKFQNGDTVLARITPCLENGKTGFIDFLDLNEIGWGSTEFIVMRGINGFGQFFVYCLSRLDAFREFAIRSMIGSSGRQRVTEPMLRDFDLAVPTNEVLGNFEKIVTPLFNQIKSNSEEIKTLSEIRDNLLPKLMKGELL